MLADSNADTCLGPVSCVNTPESQGQTLFFVVFIIVLVKLCFVVPFEILEVCSSSSRIKKSFGSFLGEGFVCLLDFSIFFLVPEK